MKTKRRHRKPGQAFPMEQLDQAVASCRNIETIALLLESAGHCKEGDQVNSAMVANAGAMVHREATQLHRVLGTFQKSPEHA